MRIFCAAAPDPHRTRSTTLCFTTTHRSCGASIPTALMCPCPCPAAPPHATCTGRSAPTMCRCALPTTVRHPPATHTHKRTRLMARSGGARGGACSRRQGRRVDMDHRHGTQCHQHHALQSPSFARRKIPHISCDARQMTRGRICSTARRMCTRAPRRRLWRRWLSAGSMRPPSSRSDYSYRTVHC